MIHSHPEQLCSRKSKMYFRETFILEKRSGAKTEIRNSSAKINARGVKINRRGEEVGEGRAHIFIRPGKIPGRERRSHFLAIFLRYPAWRTVLYLFSARNEFRIQTRSLFTRAIRYILILTSNVRTIQNEHVLYERFYRNKTKAFCSRQVTDGIVEISEKFNDYYATKITKSKISLNQMSRRYL